MIETLSLLSFSFAMTVILFFHWLFDFIFQSDEMAKKKSTDLIVLTRHIAVYTVGVSVIAFLAPYILFGVLMPKKLIALYIVFNVIAHWLTDLVTSRITSALYKQEAYHDFFVVVGFDQFIHIMTLLWSLILIGGMIT